MNKAAVISIVIALAIGLGGGYWLAMNAHKIDAEVTSAETEENKVLYYRNPMNPAITSPVPAKDEMGMDYIPVYAEESKPAQREVLYYRNPMNPVITSPVPAKDEMGMDYIPVYADTEKTSSEPIGTVKIDPVTVQNIGVRTSKVEQRTLSHTIRATGRIAYNEERLARLHPKIEGWVEALYIEKTGEKVQKNTVLLDVYSPQLVAGQQEYLLALNNYEALKNSPFDEIRSGAKELAESARQRLELLDVPAHQITELEQQRKIKKSLHIHSPFDGIVMNIGVRDGQYVTPQTELYMLADISKVWAYVDVYEFDLPWIALGDDAEMTVAAVPAKTFKGKVTHIYPYMDNKTRTIRVRLEFDNRDYLLKPDMYANVTLFAGRQVEALVVPSEAVVRSGSREQLFVVRGEGKFEPREVELGLTADGVTQIVSGVSVGEQVVTSSQFLIDSESKLREATAKMMDAMKASSGDTSTAMGDMSMDDMDMSDMDMSDMSMENMTMDDMDMSDMTMDNIQ